MPQRIGIAGTCEFLDRFFWDRPEMPQTANPVVIFFGTVQLGKLRRPLKPQKENPVMKIEGKLATFFLGRPAPGAPKTRSLNASGAKPMNAATKKSSSGSSVVTVSVLCFDWLKKHKKNS